MFLQVVRPQHDHQHVDRFMAVEDGRQRPPTIDFVVRHERVVHHSRPAIQPLGDDVVARAQFPRQDARPRVFEAAHRVARRERIQSPGVRIAVAHDPLDVFVTDHIIGRIGRRRRRRFLQLWHSGATRIVIRRRRAGCGASGHQCGFLAVHRNFRTLWLRLQTKGNPSSV